MKVSKQCHFLIYIFVISDCSSCSIKRHLSELTELIDKQGYELKNVPGDGNCLFAAVVDQLRINGDFSYNTESLRAKSVQ